MNTWLRRILGLPEQASTLAKQIDYLHYAVILTSIAGALFVGTLALYYSWRYRAAAGREAHHAPDTRPHHAPGGQSLRGELALFGGLLSLFVLFWVIGFMQYIRISEPPPGALPIYVVAKQWMWTFAYPNGGISNGTVYVPVGRPVTLVMTSRDVIHSFYVPAFRVKRDVIPGRSTTLWFEARYPGHFRIECAEYCGAGHSTMQGEVVALSDEDYARQLEHLEPVRVAPAEIGNPAVVEHESPATLLSLAAVGQRVSATAGCLRCHTVDGTPHIGPTWAGLYQATIRLESGGTVIADEAYLTKSMIDPAADIHLGFKAVMPSYQGLLTAPQVGAIVEYIRSLRDAPRHTGSEPLPALTGDIPIVTPLPDDKPSAPAADDLKRDEPGDLYAPPGGPAMSYLDDTVGLKSWLVTTDHKRIGILFLIATTIALILGGVFALILRLELLTPSASFLSAMSYNRMFTHHGVVMVFLFMVPVIPSVFGNFFLPMMLGAPDLAFPRLNLASFYVYVVGAVITLCALWFGGIDTGWTFYAPYSTTSPTSVALGAFGIFVVGTSSIMSGINFIATVHSLRAKGMKWMQLPLFVWAIYATSIIQVLATPVLGMALILVGVDHAWSLGIFDPEQGGDPVLFQHLFWFYSHPAVYVMILPAMGVVSEVVCTFAHRRPASYRAIAMSSLGIAFIGFLTWGHHMFVAGISLFDVGAFGILSMMVAIFSAIKVFTWTGTLKRGRISFKTPILYFYGFLFLFVFGGMTGVATATSSLDVHWHDTYFIVAHFHFIMVGGTLTMFLAALHYWFPKMFGRMYPEKWGIVAATAVNLGFVFTFTPQFLLGNAGMPRRYWTYPDEYQWLNVMSTAGASILAGGLAITLGYLIYALVRGTPAVRNPWDSRSFEWLAPTPPPTHNFEAPLTISRGPYDYHLPELPRVIDPSGPASGPEREEPKR